MPYTFECQPRQWTQGFGTDQASFRVRGALCRDYRSEQMRFKTKLSAYFPFTAVVQLRTTVIGVAELDAAAFAECRSATMPGRIPASVAPRPRPTTAEVYRD